VFVEVSSFSWLLQMCIQLLSLTINLAKKKWIGNVGQHFVLWTNFLLCVHLNYKSTGWSWWKNFVEIIYVIFYGFRNNLLAEIWKFLFNFVESFWVYEKFDHTIIIWLFYAVWG
jgi:hypothetical protein